MGFHASATRLQKPISHYDFSCKTLNPRSEDTIQITTEKIKTGASGEATIGRWWRVGSVAVHNGRRYIYSLPAKVRSSTAQV